MTDNHTRKRYRDARYRCFCMNCQGRTDVCLRTKSRHTARDYRALDSARTPALRQEIQAALRANEVNTEAIDIDEGDSDGDTGIDLVNHDELQLQTQIAETSYYDASPSPTTSDKAQLNQDVALSESDDSLAQDSEEETLATSAEDEGQAEYTEGGQLLGRLEEEDDDTDESDDETVEDTDTAEAEAFSVSREHGLFGATRRPPRPLSESTKADMDYFRDWVEAASTHRYFDKTRRHTERRKGYQGPTISLHRSRNLVNKIAGLHSVTIDMCPNSCIAYTGVYTLLEECPFRKCKEPRRDAKGSSRKTFQFLPVLPRISAKLQHGQREAASYRKARTEQARETLHTARHVFKDFADGEIAAMLDQSSSNTDTHEELLFLSLDGAQWKTGAKSDGWLVLATRLNLNPEIRYTASETMLITVIPGPKAPADLDSFLRPIVEEITGASTEFWDSSSLSYRPLKARVVGVCADQPGSFKVSKLTGTKGRRGCRGCNMIAAYSPDAMGQSYFPLRTPGPVDEEDDAVNHIRPRTYDPMNLPLRSHEGYLDLVNQLEAATDDWTRKEIARLYGVKGKTLFHDLDTFRFPFFFPLDLFHLSGLNMPQLVIKALTQAQHGDKYTMTPTSWREFGHSVVASGSGLPVAFCSGTPRNPVTALDSFKAFEYSTVLYYHLGAYLLEVGAPIEINQLLHDLRQGMALAHSNEGLSQSSLMDMHRLFSRFCQAFEDYFVRGEYSTLDRATISLHYLLHLRDYISAHGSARISSQACCEREIGLLKAAIRNSRMSYVHLFNRLRDREAVKMIDWIIPDKETPVKGSTDRLRVKLKITRHGPLKAEQKEAIADAEVIYGFAAATLIEYGKFQLDSEVTITGVRACSSREHTRQSSIIRLQDDEGQDHYGEAVQFMVDRRTRLEYVLIDQFVNPERTYGYIRVDKERRYSIWQVNRIRSLLGRYDIRESTYLFDNMKFVTTINRFGDSWDLADLM